MNDMKIKKNNSNNLFRIPLKGKLKRNHPLSSLTWFKVGGKAEIFYEPYDTNDLISLIKGIKKNIPILIMGAGSNLLIRDGGISGIVIKLGKKFSSDIVVI